jgi:hypothetical protein
VQRLATISRGDGVCTTHVTPPSLLRSRTAADRTTTDCTTTDCTTTDLTITDQPTAYRTLTDQPGGISA